MRRRTLLRKVAAGAGAAAVMSLTGCAFTGRPAAPRVVVVGGGFGGATAAKYLRLFSAQDVEVVLVEPQPAFVSCPLSNLVLGGSIAMDAVTLPYDTLARRHGVTLVEDRAARIDAARRRLVLARGGELAYDRLVLSPGVDLMLDQVDGLAAAQASGRILQAWKAGPETAALRRQLEALPDGGVYAITIPEQPFRCPPGPYERACQVAWYFSRHKPRAKVLVLDANPDVVSKPALFRKVWAEQYPGMVEYRPNHKVVAVDANELRVKFELHEDVRAGVLNVLSPMRAGAIAVGAGLANQVAGRWCGVHWRTFESTAASGIHVLGDATLAAPGMPKSAHMANNHAKVAAAAIVAQLSGHEPPAAPMLTNTCYSFVDDRRVVHVASVHAYDGAGGTFRAVPGSGGLSAAPSDLEGAYAWNWARNIWGDALA